MLISIPVLPASLIRLYCYGCFRLNSLPNLPVSLNYLYCSGCPRLTNLPLLPASLTHLDCYNKWLSIKDIGILNQDYPKNIRKLTLVQKMIKKHYLRYKFNIRTILKKETTIPMDIINSICREYL
jgi:hypothetical protein